MELNRINMEHRIRSEKNEKKSQKKAEQSNYQQVKEADVQKSSKAWAAYAAALLALGGVVPGATSCVQQEQYTTVNFDQEELKNMLREMLSVQQQILEQLQQNNNDNKDIIEQLMAINDVLNQINSGVIDINEGLVTITGLIQDSNSFDQEFLNKIDEIIAGQGSQEEKLQQILEENQKQTAFLANIQPYIESIASINQGIADKLEEFYQAFLDGEISHSEFMQKLLDAVNKNTGVSEDILAAVNELKAAYEAGHIEEADLLDQIAQLLAKIDYKMDAVIEALNDINSNILNLTDKVDQNHDETFAKLEEIANRIDQGFNITESQLKDLIALNKEGNNNVLELMNDLEEMKMILNQIKNGEGNMKLEELITKYGDIMDNRFQEVLDKLDSGINISDDDINALIASINASKNDLSKIQEDLGTIIALLRNAQESEISAADLQNIVDAINGLRDSNEQGTEAVQGNLQEILESLADINGMLEVINKTQQETLNSVNKYGAAAEVAYEELIDGIDQLKAGQIKIEEVQDMWSEFTEKSNQVLQYQSQAVTLLQALLDSQGAGENGLTLEEINDLINNNELFNDIKGLLADLNIDRVTNETLNEALNNHRTDLSKIQEDMGTIIAMLRNLNIGDVTVDTSALEATINELKSAIDNQGITSNTSMEQIKKDLATLIELLEQMQQDEENPNPETRSISLSSIAENSIPSKYGAADGSTIHLFDAYSRLAASEKYNA